MGGLDAHKVHMPQGYGASNLALRGWILFEGEQFVAVVFVLFSAQGDLGGQVRQGA